MAIAIYRGIKYDTDVVKKEYEEWWKKIHHDASKRLSYRGLSYRTCKTSFSENVYFLSSFGRPVSNQAREQV